MSSRRGESINDRGASVPSPSQNGKPSMRMTRCSFGPSSPPSPSFAEVANIDLQHLDQTPCRMRSGPTMKHQPVVFIQKSWFSCLPTQVGLPKTERIHGAGSLAGDSQIIGTDGA